MSAVIVVAVLIVAACAVAAIAIGLSPAPRRIWHIDDMSVEQLEARREELFQRFVRGQMKMGQMQIWPDYDRMLERMILRKRSLTDGRQPEEQGE